MERYFQKVAISAILLLAALNGIIWHEVFRAQHRPDMAVIFFDVGQGDSELVESKDGTKILIDGGPTNKILSLLASYLPYYDRTLDAIVVTHAHRDHVVGLIEVLKNYNVGRIFWTGAEYKTPEYDAFIRLVVERRIPMYILDGRPTRVSFFDGAELKFLAPTKSFVGRRPSKMHDAMVVAQLSYGGRRVLFMGDAEKNIEHILVEKGVIEDVNVLKVGHHGSKNSSMDFFLAATHPEFAVISVGQNRYGLPNPDAIERLQNAGANVLRTDHRGTIQAAIDRGELLVSSEK